MKNFEITDIEKMFPNWYSKQSDLAYDDQKYIWEHTSLPTEDQERLKQIKNKDIVIVNGSVNGSYKRQANTSQSISKQDAIFKLKGCNYTTPPSELTFYLESYFKGCGTKEGHWLWIAQHYNPKSIVSVINNIIKLEERKDETIKNPAAFFTSIIKKRKMRKKFRSTNGGTKPKHY